MKSKLILFTLFFTLIFIGCEKYESETYDFSDSLPNFVEFKSIKSLAVAANAKAPFTITTKSVFFNDVAVVVKIEGNGINEVKTVTLPKMKISVDESFIIPSNSVKGTQFSIKIVSATADGTEVRLGRVNPSTTEIQGKVN